MIPGSFGCSSHDTGIDGPFLSFEQALINHYQAAQQRKHREKRVKFLQAAENKLTEEINVTAKRAQECMQKLETLYQKFIFEHSVSEDRITALWGKIHGLAVKYRDGLEDLQKDKTAQQETIEEKQITSLAKIRKACEASENIVKQLKQDIEE